MNYIKLTDQHLQNYLEIYIKTQIKVLNKSKKKFLYKRKTKNVWVLI